MHFLFLTEVPNNEPLKVHKRGLYGDSCPLLDLFLNIPQIPHQISTE